MIKNSLFILILVIGFLVIGWLTACQPMPPMLETNLPDVNQVTISPQPTVTLVASSIPRSTNTSRASPTPSPTAELFTCLPPAEYPPEVNSIQILYVNEDEVWLWNEETKEKMPVELPADAVAPHLSPDGRYIAFLTEGRAVSRVDKPLEAIPLRILDRLENTLLEVGEFNTQTTHLLYPQAERVYLQLTWEESPEEAGLVEAIKVDVFAEAWGVGTESTVGERYRVSLPDGTITLVRESPAPQTSRSPDGRYDIFEIPQGLRLLDRKSGEEQLISLAPACPDIEVCYLTGGRSIIWRVDSSGFFTTSARNAYFDERAETILYFVQVDPVVKVVKAVEVRANPATFSYSPDRRFLAFWNQPDVDNAPPKTYNWVTLKLMDLQTFQERRYTQGWVLRLVHWSPDSRRFLLSSSPFGGPNPITKNLAVGDLYRPPEELIVPPKQVIMQARWLDKRRVVMWTAPEDGIPERYLAGMYFYDLALGRDPLKIDDVVQDYAQLYGLRYEMVVLN